MEEAKKVTEMETKSDVNPSNLLPSNSSSVNKEHNESGSKDEISTPRVQFDPNALYYDMTGDKYLVIFNHYEYQNESAFYYKNPHKKRKGTDNDVKALEYTFTKLGFEIDTYHDETFESIWDKLLNLQKRDFSSASCLVIAILTHGSNQDQLCAFDRPYSLKDVTKLFEGLPSLAGKPKLLFVQACRGENKDSGCRIAVDGDGDHNVIVTPSHSDFLIMRSTVEDYLSYRDKRGSWMIQELCKAIRKHHEEYDILQIITIVQQKIAHGYLTYTPKNAATNNKVQMPETTFTLTKFLKF